MPQIVPVSDFRADVKSVSKYTDRGEVVVLTQNGRPRWAMVDYDEWNASAHEQECMIARLILETEAREAAGELSVLSADEWLAVGRGGARSDEDVVLRDHRGRGERSG